MNFNSRIIIFILATIIPLPFFAQNKQSLSFEDALNMLQSGSQSLKIADKDRKSVV